MGLGMVLLLGVVVQGAESDTSTLSITPPALHIISTPPVNPTGSQDKLLARKQTILLWPKDVTTFVQEYSSWDSWLEGGSGSPYTLRDELLIFVRAIAAKAPGLEIATDEPQSDLIVVSGDPAALTFLLERLRDHPLLAQFTEDTPTQREEARSAWAMW